MGHEEPLVELVAEVEAVMVLIILLQEILVLSMVLVVVVLGPELLLVAQVTKALYSFIMVMILFRNNALI